MNKVLSIPLIVFSLIITFANNAEAARCKGVTLTYSFHDKFEYTYSDVNNISEPLNIKLKPTVTGQCKKSNKELDQQLYLIGYSTKPTSNCNSSKNPFTIMDPAKVLQYEAYTCPGIIALSWENSTGVSSVTPSSWSETNEITDFRGISLTKPLQPGETIVDTSFLRHANYASMLDGDPNTVEKENITINMPNQIKLIYKATCRASVNDVDFGKQYTNRFKDLERTIDIKINCHETLPSYKILVTSDYGVKEGNQGYIKSNNDLIGFELKWGGNEVGKKDEAVSFGETIAAKRPTTPNFTIPIKVKPVLFGEKIKQGDVEAAVTIKLTYN